MKQRIPGTLQGGNRTLTELSCAQCGDPFLVVANLADHYSTCSPACTSLRRSVAKIALTCAWCDGVFWIAPGDNRRNKAYCSNPCRLGALNAAERMKQDPSLNARLLTRKGYVRIWDGARLVMEHRWVMERHIGRPLRQEERIHHINGRRDDNALSNLVLYANHAEHLRLAHPELVKNLPGR